MAGSTAAAHRYGPVVPDAPEDRGRGILLATGGMLLLSTESVTIRLAGTEPFVLVTWVGLLPALVTLATTAWRDPAALRPDRGGTGVVLLAGALQGGTVVLFVCAVASTTVADVAVVIACAPLVTAVLAWVLLRERSPARVWAAVAASVVGILIVTWGSMGGGRLGGVLLALGAVVAEVAGREPTAGAVASAVELVLEGLHLSKRLNKDAVGGRAQYRTRG